MLLCSPNSLKTRSQTMGWGSRKKHPYFLDPSFAYYFEFRKPLKMSKQTEG